MLRLPSLALLALSACYLGSPVASSSSAPPTPPAIPAARARPAYRVGFAIDQTMNGFRNRLASLTYDHALQRIRTAPTHVVLHAIQGQVTNGRRSNVYFAILNPLVGSVALLGHQNESPMRNALSNGERDEMTEEARAWTFEAGGWYVASITALSEPVVTTPPVMFGDPAMIARAETIMPRYLTYDAEVETIVPAHDRIEAERLLASLGHASP